MENVHSKKSGFFDMIKSMAQTRSILQTKFTQLRQSILLRMQNRLFWRNSGLLLLANVIVTGLGLLRTPVMTWILPKAEVGMMGVIASWMPFVQLASLNGLDLASYHYISKGQSWAFVVNMLYRLRWTLFSTAIFLIGGAYWAWRGDTVLAWMFVITGVSFPVTSGMTYSAGLLSAQEKFVGLFWYRIWESLTDFTGFIPLAFSAWWISKVVTFYTANQIATAIMQAGISFWFAWQLKRINTPRMPKDDERAMIRYGKHLTVITAISVLQGRTDALLVGSLLSLTTMADYSIALMVTEQFRRLWGIYVSVRYPPLARMSVERRRKKFIVEGGVIWLGFIGLGLLVSLLGHWLIPLILPPSYSGSLGYMDILIATVLVGTPGALVEIYFRTNQNTRSQYIIRIVSAVIGIIAPVLLILRWGAYGAASGRFLANLVFSVLGFYLFLKDSKIINKPDSSINGA